MNRLIVIFALILAVQVHGQESYRLPANELPVTYLKKLRIDDTSRQLTEKERSELVRLFVRSYITSARKYKQDYPLETGTPVYQLLKANFPSVAEREGEGGVFLGPIMQFFNKMPAYKPIVEQALREDLGKKRRCQQ